MASLSSLANNLVERLHRGKCENCEPGLEDATFKDNTLTFKCLDCNKNSEKKFVEDLTKKFSYTYWFYDGDIDNFFCCCGKLFIHMTTRIAGKSSMRHHFP